ncbi:unnamed protein product [Leptosia nina]|uniref:RNA-directed DNA polymerase n=1 Tax=Leptosia nina TaxID=320188 RepID=A0AAV1K1L5_9NEOP
MAHADFLSRNSPVGSQDLQSKTKLINFTELQRGWLSVEQQRDSEISNIISKIQSNELPPEISHTYDVRQGILYRKIERAKSTKWLPVLPHSLIWSLISHVHAEIKHLGYGKTLDKMYELNWFQNMSRNVKKSVDSCVICKSSKDPSGAQQVRLHPIPKPAVPWHTLHLDLTGKLSGKSDRKEYCSVIVDAFTKFVVLKHTTLNCASAINAIKDSIHLFGASERIIANRGRSYDNHDFTQFCESNNMELHLIATGSSRS